MFSARRILALVGLCFVASTGTAAAQPLRLGFTDGLFNAGDAIQRDLWLGRAVAEGASFVRVDSSWSGIAKRRPADPTDPADPAYDWSAIDGPLTAATARGLGVVLTLTGAPTWAEGPDRPADAPSASWRPDAAEYGLFARALARRYAGGYAGLPRISMFEPWNEPNLSKYLSPQWVRTGSGYRAESPVLYRALLNAFYRGIKAIQPGATVVAGATAPFGDPNPGGSRIMPVRFTRVLLCLDDRLKRSGSCPDPARFDAFDHHPYSVRGPDAPALNADDVSVPDMGKLGRALAAATRAGTALPRATKQLWALEVSWDSSPPDPDGVPAATHARWLESALYRLWRQGVDTISWFLIRDQAPEGGYDATYQSGTFLLDGSPKPAATAYRFPFVCERASASRLRVWGRAPAAGSVRIERRTAGGWRLVRTVRPGGDRVFSATVALRGSHTLRAVQQGQSSLAWPAPAR